MELFLCGKIADTAAQLHVLPRAPRSAGEMKLEITLILSNLCSHIIILYALVNTRNSIKY